MNGDAGFASAGSRSPPARSPPKGPGRKATIAPATETRGRSAALWPIHLSGAATDFAAFLLHGTLYFLVLHLGGGPEESGLVMGAYAVSYLAGAVIGGRIADRAPRLVLAKGGSILFALVAAAVTRTDRVETIVAACIPMGAGMGFFWPSVQAHLADAATRARLPAALGGFNVAWSLGKGAGFFAAGGLMRVLAGLGDRPSLDACLLVSSSAALLPLFLLEGVGRRPLRVPGVAPATGWRGAPFRHIAWVANFAIVGASAVIIAHHPGWVEAKGLDKATSNLFLGAVFVSQTAAFIVWSAYGRWRYRITELLLTQVVFLAAVAAIPFVGGIGAMALLAPLIGLGLGLGYQASLFYSLDVRWGRGRLSGMHEGILGSGAFLLPPAAGYAATWTGSLAAPYLLAAAVGAAVLGVEGAMAWRSMRVR